MKRSERGGKSVTMEVSFWLHDDGSIRLTSNDPDLKDKTFHVSVRQDETKASGQPHLFRELAKCLKQMGAPAPEISN